MRGVVIHDEVQGEPCGDVGIDLPQEAEVLLVAMTTLAVTDHRAGGQIQRRKQGGGAMTNIVMGHALDIAEAHRQQRLGALQGLDLALFVHAQDHGFVRRVQVQTDNIPHLFNEKGIVRQRKVALPVRLQTESAPDAVDGVFRESALGRQQTATSMRTALRSGSQRPANQRRHALVADRARPSGAQLVVQAPQALAEKASPPVAKLTLTPPQAGVEFGRCGHARHHAGVLALR